MGRNGCVFRCRPCFGAWYGRSPLIVRMNNCSWRFGRRKLKNTRSNPAHASVRTDSQIRALKFLCCPRCAQRDIRLPVCVRSKLAEVNSRISYKGSIFPFIKGGYFSMHSESFLEPPAPPVAFFMQKTAPAEQAFCGCCVITGPSDYFPFASTWPAMRSISAANCALVVKPLGCMSFLPFPRKIFSL